jgi:hypothetical protein
MKLDLLTNATIVNDVIKFVRQQKPLSSVDINSNSFKENKEDEEKSTVPEYEEKKEKELERKKEEKPKDESIITVNKIF